MANSNRCGSFTQGKGWRKTIGRKIDKGGSLAPCRFWLGFDERKATSTALNIESFWIAQNAPYWNAAALATANEMRMGAMVSNAPAFEPERPKTVLTAKTVLTVKGAVERFRDDYLASKIKSEPSKNSIKGRTATLLRSPISNLPLSEVNAEQLASLVAYWIARPKTAKGKPISEISSRLLVKTAQAVFDHADGLGLWVAPRRFDRIFRLPKIKNAPVIKTYSVEELARLYKYAKGQMRTMILLALNCGFCSAELSSLRKDEIDLQAKIIKRARQKTQVVAQWQLWDETVETLRSSMASNGNLAFTRDNGSPLVSFNADYRRLDYLPPVWARLLKRANKDGGLPIVGSFKLLRKTGATMVRSIGGIEVSEMYLAHSEKTVARFYSVADPNKLKAVLTALRKQLAPLFA